jgi:transposase
VREIYRIADPDVALDWVLELADTLEDPTYCPEIQRLGRTLRRWSSQIAAWHRSRASNGPVEAVIIWSFFSTVFDVADESA